MVTCDILNDASHIPPKYLTGTISSSVRLLSYQIYLFQRTAMSNGAATMATQEKVNIDIVTLTRFLTEEQRKHKEATGDFTYTIPSRSCFDQQADESFTIACCAMLFSSHSSPLLTISVEQV